METIVKEKSAEGLQPLPGGFRGAIMFTVASAVPVTSTRQISEDIKVYKLHLECKHCGHEWTETKEESAF